MFDFIQAHPLLVAAALLLPGVAFWVIFMLGTWVIRESESGLVIRRFGRPLPPGRLIALRGRGRLPGAAAAAGLALRPVALAVQGERVPLVVVPPGEIALVVAEGRRADPGGAHPRREVDVRQLPGRGGVPAPRWREGPADRLPHRGHLPHQPRAVRGDHAGERGGARHATRRSCASSSVPPDRWASSRCWTASRCPRATWPGPWSRGHDSFQSAQAFLDAGGCRGLQEEVLLSGSWNLNPWFVQVELIPMTEIPIGYVGVVVSYVGSEHVDVSGDAFTHGDLVERGRKGVWVEPLLPGKHPLNTRVMKVELVPTTNIVLNWAQPHGVAPLRREALPITVRSRDGFSFSLDVVADHPHRREERAARDLARGLDAEPGGPRAAADGGQLLPQLGAGGDGAGVPLRAQRAAARGVRGHPRGDRGL